MANPYVSVIAVGLCLNFTGLSETKLQQTGGIYNNSDCWWDGKFLMNCSFTGRSTVPADMSQTVTIVDLSYNNITTLLWSSWKDEKWNIKHLNLSNNLISELSFNSFRNFLLLETLNLSDNTIHYVTLDIRKPAHWTDKHRKVPTYDFLPSLRVLSIERNNLNAIPRGLGKLQSLQSLHLSSNEISQIDQNDFQNCSQLKNIYLQTNKITKIHPDAFKNLKNLQVVNLSNNAMTALLPAIFIDLNILQFEVDLSNNPWICDCRLITFKHFISFLSESLRKKWNILCSKPASNSGPLLLSLKRLHLNCAMAINNISFKKIAVPIGETAVLDCGLDKIWGNEEIYWWTAIGRISKDNWLPHIRQDEMKNLIIYNVGKTAEGLYACIYKRMKMKYLIYDMYVKQKHSSFLVRNARDINAVIRQGRTEGDFTLAVCLSVIITFICAFCLGTFTRPYIDSIWRQICRKRSSASENTYSNQGFSSETLTRDNTANTQTSVRQNLSFCSGNSSRNVGSYIVEASSLHKVALHNRVIAPTTEEANQDQSSNYIKVQKEKVSQNSQATNSVGEADIGIDDKEFFSAMSDHQYSNKAFQRELTNNDISSCDDSKYFLNEDSEKSRVSPVAGTFNVDSYSLHIESSDLDSPFARETNFPLSEAQIQTNAHSSEHSDANNKSNLLPSEIAESLQEEMRQMTSHTQPLITQQFMLRRNNCDKELDGNDNMNMLNNSENFILPPNYESGINIENSNTHQTQKNSPTSIQEYDCKEGNTRNKANPVDMFSDSSSTEEGSAFTLSDSSSLSEGELEQSNAGDDQLTNLSVAEQVISLNSGTGKFTTLLQSSNITTRVQDIMEKHENKNEAYSETAVISGSGPGMSETCSSVLHIDSSHIDVDDTSHIDTFDDHVSLSDSKTNNHPCSEVPGMNEYVTSPNSPAQNILSNSERKQNISFNYVTLPLLQYSPKSMPDTENIISKDTCLQLCESSTLTQHFDRSTPTDQKENVTEINTEENHIAHSTSLRKYGEDGITLNIANINTPHVNNNFIFTSIDFANKASLVHSNIATDEPSLQSHSENTDEKSVVNITERQGSSVQHQQHMNNPGTCAQRMQKSFNEKECDENTEQEVLSGTDESNSSLCTAELQFHNIMTDSSPVTSPETMQSVFNGEKYLQVDRQSEENVCFSSHPQSFFNENVQHSLCKVLQNAQGNTIASRTNETENGTSLAELENSFRTVPILQNSSETPDQKNEARRGQLLAEGSLFVKKKRAFDGFASVLQSKKTDSTE